MDGGDSPRPGRRTFSSRSAAVRATIPGKVRRRQARQAVQPPSRLDYGTTETVMCDGRAAERNTCCVATR